MAFYHAEGIVFRSRPYRDADRLVTIFSPSRGRIAAVAKGVSKPRSRLRSCVQEIVHGRYLFYRGRNLDTLIQGELINSFPGWRGDLYRLTCAQYMTEAGGALILENEPSTRIFRLLLTGLGLLEDGHLSARLVLCFFQARLIRFSGYRPRLTGCCRCERPLGPAGVFFSPGGGGVVCAACATTENYALPVRRDAIALWRYLENVSSGHLSRIMVTEDRLAHLETLLSRYLAYHTGMELKTPAFLAGLASHV